MGKFLKRYVEFLKVDGWIFLLLLILNSTPIFQALLYKDAEIFKGLFFESLRIFYCGALVILIFCMTVCFGMSKFPRAKFFLQLAVLVLFAASFAVDIFLLYTFRATLQPHFVEIAFNTNPNEVKEFLLNYVLQPKIIFAVVIFAVFIVAASKKFYRMFQNLPEKVFRRIVSYTLIILIPAVVISVTWIFGEILTLAQDGTIIGRNFFNAYTAFRIAGGEPEIFAEMNRQDEKIISNGAEIPYVIFVLGESTTRNHMQLYGYNLETTPLAVKRYERGELFKFNDVISCANDTSAAMKLIFTFSEKEHETENWYKTPNIFDILRRAGYHTAWISNQSPIGWLGNLDKIYSERCNEKYFTDVEKNGGKSVFTRDYDSILLPVIDNFISRAEAKNFYLIHLYGTHEIYSERYTKNFAKFTADDEDKTTEKAKRKAAEYDNAVLYNDFILDEIFKRFEDKNALIIYISDHGEDVFEDGKDFSGHSTEEQGNLSMIEIPMLIWTSEKFRELYPEKIDALKSSCDNPYRTDLIIHTILDLTDIQTENFDPSKSIVNKKFDKYRPRIYNNKPYFKN